MLENFVQPARLASPVSVDSMGGAEFPEFRAVGTACAFWARDYLYASKLRQLA